MPRFTTRVELHDADSDDYESLHAAMERQGFSRQITDGEGKRYHLPTAEYNFDGKATKEEVLGKAKAAANTIRLQYEVLVTESNGRTWHRLTRV